MKKITEKQFNEVIDPEKDHIPMTEEEEKIADGFLRQEYGDIIRLIEEASPDARPF